VTRASFLRDTVGTLPASWIHRIFPPEKSWNTGTDFLTLLTHDIRNLWSNRGYEICCLRRHKGEAAKPRILENLKSNALTVPPGPQLPDVSKIEADL